MNSTQFASYKMRYRSAIAKILAESEPGRLDEAGFPAYSHPNPLINWLFWQRLRVAMNYIEKGAPYERALDFGCGSGVMLPFLAGVSKHVVALDIDLIPLERMGKHIPSPANVEVLDSNKLPISALPARSFDIINALDVLEHVEDLSRTLSDLLKLLKPGGQLVVSGPTENIFYRIGRRLAGPEYTGHYHDRGIAEIRDALEKLAKIQHIATLYQPVPLFEIFAARV